MSFKPIDDRQVVNRAALSAIGSAANSTLDAVFADIDTIFGNATSLATPSVLMKRDANANTQVNNLIENLTSTATSAGTTTLLNSSTYFQQFTGTNTESVVLPDATTLIEGQAFCITNRSTGTITVNANGGGLIQSMAANSQAIITVTSIATSAGTWDSSYSISDALSNPMNTLGDTIYGGTSGTPTRLAGNTTSTPQVLMQTGTGSVSAPPVWTSFVAPTTQIFQYSGSVVTYTLPTSPRKPLYIRVRGVAGGGGGGGSGTTSFTTGGTGGQTYFGSSFLVASGGSGGNNASTGGEGLGGSASVGAGANGVEIAGGNGFLAANINSGLTYQEAGGGGVSMFGGGGSSGATAWGCGGSGASIASSPGFTGHGGGAGAGFDALVPSPASNYSIFVGGGGGGGSGNDSSGSGGQNGILIVDEFYQ